jgi:HAD superfamily hydrolase (TIGR01484 family)
LDKLKPIKTINTEDCRKLEFFFMDIDDTLSLNGKIPDFAFSALWKLYNSGIKLIPVTGRPAGWCDHIARMWPVEAVIGENGAFYFSYDTHKKMMKREYFETREQLEANRRKLSNIRNRVLKEVPGAGISADQDYRISDLAIDFCEDVENLNRDAVDAICGIAGEEGAFYAVSSIHINCWYGDFNKAACIKKYLSENSGHYEDSMKKSVFIGDSPNDEPIFRIFLNSIGVANIIDFKDRIVHYPMYITKNRSASGFREAADIILRNRES